MPVALLLLAAAAPRVVITYARPDRPAAELAERELAAAGCQVWTDRHIRPGEPWARAIERAIDAADIVIAMLGEECSGCRDEHARAKRQGKRIVPVLIRAGAIIPLDLEQLQRATLTELAQECKPDRHATKTSP